MCTADSLAPELAFVRTVQWIDNRLAELPPHIFALIIGINEYESPRIPNLVEAVPDADAMQDYLQKHLNVPRTQIRNLRNSEATRAAIINGINFKRPFHSTTKLKRDPILIYYAGHGGSADGWEVGSTGKIELLVPYDHSSPLEDANPKQGIPDRTLGALLRNLQLRRTVILDCCHSGSSRRILLDPVLKARTVDVGNVTRGIVSKSDCSH